ncbi:hypothetical protein LIER_31732 [Lithospermum erythrorhizon]|uniref:Uncharacterized protein n=1 Tax=Lithospermum erythrorhizon TaxID=34254 RepID=A0AAV3RVG0_LITER
MFHKVKVRGMLFNFSPAMINKHCDVLNGGLIGSTLKLNDIIQTLTGGLMTGWPIKGQLQASTLNLSAEALADVADPPPVPATDDQDEITHVC